MEITLSEIARLVEGKIEEGQNTIIKSLSKIEFAKNGDLSFLGNYKYEQFIYSTSASAVLIPKGFSPERNVNSILIEVTDPYASFTRVLELFEQENNKNYIGIEDPTFISKSAEIGNNTYVGAFTHIDEKVIINDNVKIHQQVSVGANSTIGEGTIIHAGVKIYPNTQIGKDCIIHAGTVIGSEGFGFNQNQDKSYQRIPHIGNVVLKDKVRIGANCTIDRASIGSTIINRGVILDNQIQIAHNVEIGEHTAIAAQVAIAGSAKIGKFCKLGGQVAIGGHIHIADHTSFAGKSAISKEVKEKGKTFMGVPAKEFKEYVKDKNSISIIPKLEAQLKELKEKLLP